MKKYLIAASLFLADNEIISLVALIAIVLMFLLSLVDTAEKEGKI